MDRDDLMFVIRKKCKEHGCSDKIAKMHFDQFVNRRWNPHPSQKFVNWWGKLGVKAAEEMSGRAWGGIDAVRAFNCQAVQDSYEEAKEHGIA